MTENLNQEEERQLILSLKEGNLGAFEKTLLLYEKQIFNHIYRLVGQLQDAQDLLQETFIKLYKNRSRIDTNKSFKAWLYKIATNTTYDWFRKKSHYRGQISLDEIDEEKFETIDTQSPYYRIEASNDVAGALEGIKAAYRNILLLYYRDGFSYEEIADILGIPLNTVKTHLSRAKKQLKEKLESSYGK